MPEPIPYRILIVDDDSLFIKGLSDILEDEGYSVVVANSGQAGIDTFQTALRNHDPFALVFTDLGMEPVDGRQVAAAVKAVSPATPVILVSGWGKWFEGSESLPLPVDCVLAKPIQLHELRYTLARCLPAGMP